MVTNGFSGSGPALRGPSRPASALWSGYARPAPCRSRRWPEKTPARAGSAFTKTGEDQTIMVKIICITDTQIAAGFKNINSEWLNPIDLDANNYWEDDETPQVEEPCPNCKIISDRTFNMTKDSKWALERCKECEAVWFWKIKEEQE